MRTASPRRRPTSGDSAPASAAGRGRDAAHRRRLVYLETLDPLYDHDGGVGRMLYRIRRDFPWVLTEGWELERWGVWPTRRPTSAAGAVRGPRLPGWVPTHPAFVTLAWTVHLALAIRRPRCGLVVAYNPFTALGVALAGLLQRSPPLAVRVIGNISSKALVVHRSRLRARLLDAVERFVLRRADLVIPMGAFTRELARRAGADENRIIELPHPTRWFGEEADAAPGDGPVRIVAAGRFVASKGFDVLLRAFAVLADDAEDVVLELAGDGPERRRLEGLVADLGLERRVRFHGWLPAERMPRFFGGALVSVLPSRVEEGLGMVLVEAGVAGCALVGSDLGGIRDIVRPARTGVLVPPGDSAAMATALRRLVIDRDEARRLGAGARAAALAYLGDRDAALRALRQRLDELRPGRHGRWAGRAR